MFRKVINRVSMRCFDMKAKDLGEELFIQLVMAEMVTLLAVFLTALFVASWSTYPSPGLSWLHLPLKEYIYWAFLAQLIGPFAGMAAYWLFCLVGYAAIVFWVGLGYAIYGAVLATRFLKRVASRGNMVAL